MLMDLMVGCKINHLVHCSWHILCEVHLPKAIDFPRLGPLWGPTDEDLAVLRPAWVG